MELSELLPCGRQRWPKASALVSWDTSMPSFQTGSIQCGRAPSSPKLPPQHSDPMVGGRLSQQRFPLLTQVSQACVGDAGSRPGSRGHAMPVDSHQGAGEKISQMNRVLRPGLVPAAPGQGSPECLTTQQLGRAAGVSEAVGAAD